MEKKKFVFDKQYPEREKEIAKSQNCYLIYYQKKSLQIKLK